MDTTQRPKRGLGALLATTTGVGTLSPAGEGSSSGGVTAAEVALSSISPNPSQPRTQFGAAELDELAASIKARGLIQPVVVRQLKPSEANANQKYELIAGERRWRASQMAGLTHIPVIIKDVFEDRDILLLSLVENIQRDDLNPIDEAAAYDKLSKTFNLTHEQIADGVGKNRASVSNAMRLLELPSSVQDALKSGRLSAGHAKVLLQIPDAKIQAQLAAKAQAENLTVRDLERLVAGAPAASSGVPLQTRREKGSRNTSVALPHLQEVERQLREHFGTRVRVEEGLRKGRIIVEFYSVEDFGRILKLMNINT